MKKSIMAHFGEIEQETEALKKSIAEYEGTIAGVDFKKEMELLNNNFGMFGLEITEDANMYPEDDYGARPDDYDTMGFTLEDIRGQY